MTLKVYGPTGQLVNTLLDSRVEPGRHAVRWNGETTSGEQVSPGIYFVRMETPGFNATKKVVIVR
jgi:flagellar hook assembly protein FlgD